MSLDLRPEQNKYTYAAAVVAIGLFVLLGMSYLNLQRQSKQTKADLEAKLATLEFDLKTTAEGLENFRQENATLTEKILAYEQNIESLEDRNKRLDRENEELEKIVETDPELLKKYSKVYFLNENYAPPKLSIVDKEFVYPEEREVKYLRNSYKFLEDLLEDAHDDDIDLRVTSGYRSFDEQMNLKNGYKVTYGAGTANQFSAEQGYSEHQIGTAVDFTLPSMNGVLSEAFDKTEAFTWLKENAYKYGFILSYPKGNTYYQYEPWHWRFVGQDLARDLHKKGQNFYDLDQREIDKYLGEIFD